MTVSRALWAVLLLPLLAGCETLAYYGQSIHGQLDVMHRAEPIDTLLTESDLTPGMARRLMRVKQLRRFASERLALPDNGSYNSYADLGRRAMVWSVVATPRFDLAPRSWCYPVVGCLAYRGYFDHADALARADRLRAEGLDVAVLAVPAYSTLGWFDDPLPSTVIHWPEPELAGLMFHELAHQQLYVAGDTAFNESYATAVAEQGVRLWLAKQGDAAPDGFAAWRQRRDRAAQVTRLLLDARERLAAAFNDAGDDTERVVRKQALYAELAAAYRSMSRDWPPPRPYRRWFDGEQSLNNAHLAQVALYDRWVPAFRVLWRRAGDDPARFHVAVARLAELSPSQRLQRMEDLLAVALRPASGAP